MNSIKQLNEIRHLASKKMDPTLVPNGFRVVVGMATCGIAAGAKPVYSKLCDLIEENNLTNVTLVQVGCIGECAVEPVVEVCDHFGVRTTYAKVNPKVVERIVNEHLMQGLVVSENLIENIRAKVGK